MSKRFYSKKSEELARDAYKAQQAGSELTDLHEVRRLEDRLRRDHTDVITRCTLMGFYRESKLPEATDEWFSHVEWLIKNCPDEKLMAGLWVPDSVSHEQYDSLKDSFLQKVARNPKNANVVGHAAMFLRKGDSHLKKRLYKRAKRLAPQDWRWRQRLFYLYSLEARQKDDEKVAAKAFKEGQKCLRMLKKQHQIGESLGVIKRLCDLALEMDQLKLAALFIREFKDSEIDSFWPFMRHMYQGLLAMKNGDIDRAQSQLLKYAHKGGYLGDFRLANQLVELDESPTVVKFLIICLKEHPDEEEKELVHSWLKPLRQGKKFELSFPGRQNS